MKRQMFFATVFSAALATGVAAQTGTGAQPPQTGQQDRQKQEQVTMTGCLQQADPAISGTSGTGTTGTGTAATGAQRERAGASGESQFILANATKVSGGASGTAGTTGAAAEPSSASSMNKYRLIGKEDELKKHVNAQVEIRGTLDERYAGSASPGAGTGTAAAGSAASTEKLPALRVTSVRKIADTCAAK